jgi:hypothetical protein
MSVLARYNLHLPVKGGCHLLFHLCPTLSSSLSPSKFIGVWAATPGGNGSRPMATGTHRSRPRLALFPPDRLRHLRHALTPEADDRALTQPGELLPKWIARLFD